MSCADRRGRRGRRLRPEGLDLGPRAGLLELQLLPDLPGLVLRPGPDLGGSLLGGLLGGGGGLRGLGLGGLAGLVLDLACLGAGLGPQRVRLRQGLGVRRRLLLLVLRAGLLSLALPLLLEPAILLRLLPVLPGPLLLQLLGALQRRRGLPLGLRLRKPLPFQDSLLLRLLLARGGLVLLPLLRLDLGLDLVDLHGGPGLDDARLDLGARAHRLDLRLGLRPQLLGALPRPPGLELGLLPRGPRLGLQVRLHLGLRRGDLPEAALHEGVRLALRPHDLGEGHGLRLLLGGRVGLREVSRLRRDRLVLRPLLRLQGLLEGAVGLRLHGLEMGLLVAPLPELRGALPLQLLHLLQVGRARGLRLPHRRLLLADLGLERLILGLRLPGSPARLRRLVVQARGELAEDHLAALRRDGLRLRLGGRLGGPLREPAAAEVAEVAAGARREAEPRRRRRREGREGLQLGDALRGGQGRDNGGLRRGLRLLAGVVGELVRGRRDLVVPGARAAVGVVRPAAHHRGDGGLAARRRLRAAHGHDARHVRVRLDGAAGEERALRHPGAAVRLRALVRAAARRRLGEGPAAAEVGAAGAGVVLALLGEVLRAARRPPQLDQVAVRVEAEVARDGRHGGS
mmetsp:Transcript_106249/g.228926  ORF Transcript_106249/g.228926 Transcript_106249/m.228926 type:complete len:627 (-) Transcript_106249:129-2009(-)